ncbi:MAG: cyclic pyranopterin monophosphate synthase MoaC [Caldiserica bacterium]|nr:cyclic pyranopterin monophosphate synthase MoaC [Caldisericota bacterium]
MVDVGDKPPTRRAALAAGRIELPHEVLQDVIEGRIEKGDVLAVAQVAGIMGAKLTPQLVPLCHTLPGLEAVDIRFEAEQGGITVYAEVHCTGKTGVEMEAMAACTAALLAIYDMCKSRAPGAAIKEIVLLEKTGGKSGRWTRDRA